MVPQLSYEDWITVFTEVTMYTTIEQFRTAWTSESNNTRKILEPLTDDTIGQRVADDHRTLGRIAWHIITTIPEMTGHVGLKISGPAKSAPVPSTAEEMKKSYDQAASSFLDEVVKNWNDDSLKIVDDLYGEKWKRGLTLRILIDHEIHHRGQMTILMRQAGLKVPGIYGPSKEEWAQYKMQEPEI